MNNLPVPDFLESDTQYARFHHLDIPYLDSTQLVDELYALHPLLWGLQPDHWLRERVNVLKSELAKRRSYAKPKAKVAEEGK
jgi:hypothetical protein